MKTSPLARGMTRNRYSMGAPSHLIVPGYFIAAAVWLITRYFWYLLPVALVIHAVFAAFYRKDEYELNNFIRTLKESDHYEA